MYFYGEQCFVLYCSLSSSSSSSSQTKGLSRDERALLEEIASERMRARGERSVRACFPRLVSKIKFSRKNSRGSILVSFFCVSSLIY